MAGFFLFQFFKLQTLVHKNDLNCRSDLKQIAKLKNEPPDQQYHFNGETC